MNELQNYRVHEYVADYKAGFLSRRDLVQRVLNITGGVGATATLLLALGCSAPTPAAAPTSAPAAAPKPTTAPASPASAAASAAPSPAPSAASSPSAVASASASP